MALEIARDLKEAVCLMSSTPAATSSHIHSLPAIPYELPDGHLINIGANRFMVSELVCFPAAIRPAQKNLGHSNYSHEINDLTEGVPQLVSRVAVQSEPSRRAELLNGFVVTGGAAAIQGLPQRLQLDVQQLLQSSLSHLEIKTASLPSAQRCASSWIGGSILSSFSSFDEMWMTKQMYEEHGAERILELCP